jgi:hypothetical protein
MSRNPKTNSSARGTGRSWGTATEEVTHWVSGTVAWNADDPV